MPTIKTEGAHAGEFLLSEANFTRSREEVILAATAEDLPAGQILSVVADEFVPYDPAGMDGSENPVAVLFAPKPASTEPQRATVVVRDAELVDTRLTGLDDAAEQALAAVGLVVRAGTP